MPESTPQGASASNSNHAHMQPQTTQQAWIERFKRIFHRDKKLHEPGPFCLFFTCPCHYHPDYRDRLCRDYWTGFISPQEMDLIIQGRAL